MKAKIKLYDLDDELLLRRVLVRIGSVTILTPYKANEKKKKYIPEIKINEIYRQFRPNRVEAIIGDSGEEEKINREFKRKRREDAVNVSFINYERSEPLPSHLEFLADIQHEHSEIIATPIFSGILGSFTGEQLLEKLLEKTRFFIESVKQLNNRELMGTVPYQLPRQYLEPLLTYYYDVGIRMFAIDLGGKSVDSNRSWLRRFLLILKKVGIFEESFIYGINSYEGRIPTTKKEGLAKDFMSIGYGVDVIGMKHVSPKFPSYLWKQLNQKGPVYKIFNRATYGYRKMTEEEMKQQLGLIPKQRNTYNTKQQFYEASMLGEKLEEEGSVLKYIQRKTEVNERVLKKIKEVRKGLD